MKHCTRCERELPLEAFTRNPTARDGFRNQCRECQVEYNRRWREENPERSRESQRRFYRRHGRKSTQSSSPEVHRVHQVVEEAVKSGKLIRPPGCEQCGSSDAPPHAHHDDYSQPLEVRWLCPRCHGRLHRDLTNNGAE